MPKEKTKPKKRKRRRPKQPVIQMHHPSYHPFDEKFTIPLRMSHHRLVARAVQTLKNTIPNLRQIRSLIDALMAEYLIRLRELRVNGTIKDEEYREFMKGGNEDGKIGYFQPTHKSEDGRREEEGGG